MAAVLASSGGSWCGAGSLSSFFSPSPQPLSQGERGCSAGEAAAVGVSASLFCARRAALRAAARAFAASMAAVLASSGGSWCGAGAVSVVVSMLALKAGTLPPPLPSPAALRCGGGGGSAGLSATVGASAMDALPPPAGEGWGGVSGFCSGLSLFGDWLARRAALRAAARAFAASMAAVLASSGEAGAVSVVVSMLALESGTLPPPQPSPAAGANAPCRGGGITAVGVLASPFWASRSARRAAARAFAASMVAVLSSVDDSAARFADEPRPCPSSMGGGGKSAGEAVVSLAGV